MNILVATLMVAITVLRAWHLDGASIWTDEQDSLMQSRNWAEIWPSRGNGAMYFALLHAWRWCFGHSETALRSLSVVMGVLATGLSGWLAYRISNRKTALPLAIAIAGVMPILVWHARDARMYTLWSLAVLMGLHALLSFAKKGPTTQVIFEYSLANAIGLFTHSFHVFYIVGFACAALLATRTRREQLCFHAPLAAICMLIFIRIHLLAGDTVDYLAQHAFSPWNFRILESLDDIFFYLNPADSRHGEIWVGAGVAAVLSAASAIPWLNGRNAGQQSPDANDTNIAWRMTTIALWVPFLLQHSLPVRDYARLFVPVAAISTVILGAGFAWLLEALGHMQVASPQVRRTTGATIVAAALLTLGFRLPRVLTTDMEPWKQVCKYLEGHATDRWIVSELGQPETPLVHCEALRGRYLLHSPESKSYVAPVDSAHILVLRSPPWVKPDESYLRHYPPEKYKHTLVRWGPYLEATYIDEAPSATNAAKGLVGKAPNKRRK